MKFECLVLVMLVVGGSGFNPGSCSRRCSRIGRSQNTEDKYPCSCGPSCIIYGDCCRDSNYRPIGAKVDKKASLCLPLAGYGEFQAVGSCPASWETSHEFCRDGLGILQPVTSKVTGTTYTNIHCAICNNDADRILTWDTKTTCCRHSNHNIEDDVGRFLYRNNTIVRISLSENNVLKFCQCEFRSDSNQFLQQAKIRSCTKTGISKCSMTWTDKSYAEVCKSYLEPIVIRDKVYRNYHCAVCNYEKLDDQDITCMPSKLSHLLGRNQRDEWVKDFCKNHEIPPCSMSLGKGHSQSFSEFFITLRQECVPPPGENCCEGYRYDFRKKKCRKLASG